MAPCPMAVFLTFWFTHSESTENWYSAVYSFWLLEF